MAKIDVKNIVRELERELKIVLIETLGEVIPDAKVDKDKLFRGFKERVDRNFRKPMDVSDEFVQLDVKR